MTFRMGVVILFWEKGKCFLYSVPRSLHDYFVEIQSTCPGQDVI